ncbi:MAG: alpha/beta hydrolase [Bacteroidetes bacterium]|nr:MAG: alpha/beta hydrolase [Bacteroidota bacterium]
MKLFPFLGLLLPLLLTGCAQFTLRNAAEESFVLDSDATGYSYEITVLLPPDYDPARTYPSVYLIDGHWHYLYVASDAKRLMQRGDIEDIILVGIAYAGIPNNTLGGYSRISDLRIDDLTAVKNVEEAERGGKALAFRTFLAQDLIPEIEGRYATGPQGRTLLGHSLGGFFGIWEMLTFPDSSLFAQIHAGSPALWWADGYLLAEEEQIHAAGQALPFDFLTDMGELEGVTWNAFFDEFEARVEAHAHPGLQATFRRYPRGHSHNAETGFKAALSHFFGR